jgi:small subunit ribosomal protein S4
MSEYSRQLLAKRRLSAVYGNLSLNTLKKVLNRAKKSRKFKVEALVRILETRLDTCLYRMNLFVSFASLRQLINHGYIYVNNKRVTKPGYCLSFGDIVSLSPRSKQILKPGFRARLKTNSFKIRIAKKENKTETKEGT